MHSAHREKWTGTIYRYECTDPLCLNCAPAAEEYPMAFSWCIMGEGCSHRWECHRNRFPVQFHWNDNDLCMGTNLIRTDFRHCWPESRDPFDSSEVEGEELIVEARGELRGRQLGQCQSDNGRGMWDGIDVNRDKFYYYSCDLGGYDH